MRYCHKPLSLDHRWFGYEFRGSGCRTDDRQVEGHQVPRQNVRLLDVRPGSIVEYSYTYKPILVIKLPDGLKDSTSIAVRNHPEYGALLFFDLPTNDLTPLGQISGNLQDNYGLLVTPDGG